MTRKTIVVSGCTKGIGRAICDLFASRGYHIAGYARTATDIRDMEAHYRQTYPDQQFLFLPADAAVKQEVLAFGQTVLRTFGEVDILINNAGYYIQGNILTEPEGALETMIHTHLYSAYHLTRALGTGVRQQIVNMCSIASLAAYEGGASYTIAKFALLGFSRQLRHELKKSGVKVTAILPGAVRTGSWDGTTLPDSRFIQPDDLAQTIFQLCCLSEGADIEELIIRPQQGDL